MGSINIFSEKMLNELLETEKNNLHLRIENEKEDYLLNVNEEEYIKYTTSQCFIEPPTILIENIYASSLEKNVPAEHFPWDFNVLPGKSYKKNIIKFSIPFEGNSELFRFRPSTYIVWTQKIEISNDEISFEIINFRDDVNEINRTKDSIVKNISDQYIHLKKDLDDYNRGVESKVRNCFKIRKEKLLKQNNLMASLGVPIKKINSPSTFSIPSIEHRKPITIDRPKVHEVGFKSEPCLDMKIYGEILKLIHDVGKSFERLPSLYANKEEEHLRDHFLMMLEPNFQGTATGETFNKTGKTDILLRYEGKNVFIAECKFWKGMKGFHETISQLLGYLTWRDSKASVIFFVQNKDFSQVLTTVKNEIDKHPNYLRFIKEDDETWFNYEFHLNEDRNRVVKIAAMLYHLPK